MAGSMVHARNGYIFTSGLQSDVIIVFLDPDFLKDAENLGDSVINKGYIAYFSLRMRETAVFPLPV